MPLMKTFWSPCFGMLEDQFGVGWMVTVVADPVKQVFAVREGLGAVPMIRPALALCDHSSSSFMRMFVRACLWSFFHSFLLSRASRGLVLRAA